MLYVKDGNDPETVDQAIGQAKLDPRPSLIVCRTHIGFGLPTKQDTAAAHGAPPGDDDGDTEVWEQGWQIEYQIDAANNQIVRRVLDKVLR